MNNILKRLQTIEDELIKQRKQRNYELNNLDEDNIPRLREYSQIISENQAAVSLIMQEVSDTQATVTLLSQYTDFSNVVVVESSDDKTSWDKSRVYYDSTAKVYYYHDGTQWKTTDSPITAGLDTSIAQIQAKAADNEAAISLVSQSVTQNTADITDLQTLAGQIDNELTQVTKNLASVSTKADDAAASAELAAQSVTELESEVNGQIKTLTQNVASVKTTADSASASVSAIVSNVGSNGSVTAASVVAKINAAGSAVQISADHISLKGKTIALTTDSIDISSTYFNVATSGAVSCTSLDVSGSNSSINVTGSNSSFAFLKVSNASNSGQYTVISPAGAFSYYGYYGASVQNQCLYAHYNNGNQYFHAYPYEIVCNNLQYMYPVFHANSNAYQVIVGGQFSCYGLKSRAEQTEHYRDRLMYAFETPNPLYSDFGRAEISDDGLCYIYIDPVFYECIDNSCDYYVFIQPEEGGDFTVTERRADHFIVSGSVGKKFAWMLVTAQKGYSATRNEEIYIPEPEPTNEPNTENIAYDSIGDDILKEFENQLG